MGALRKAAEGHDVSIRALSNHKDGRSGSVVRRLRRQRERADRQQGLKRPPGCKAHVGA